ncbi:hypothetical protein K3495_g13109 [Podosphaera aphanis]|nr:hypothetical protein K3495_g13109 [Podosphaera aphanis]
MERKRKLPARAARGESTSKKRTATPPESLINNSSPASLANPAPERTPLPTYVAPGKPLPTVPQAQPTDLPSREYQSISESGVLSESLLRSRQKWTAEGIFEKYWTKVRKGKNASGEPPGNPSKDSMTKIGTCTITVEPHIFEATMYAVKDSTSGLISSQLPRQTPPLPTLQYGPPGGVLPLQTSDQQNQILTSQSPIHQNQLTRNKSTLSESLDFKPPRNERLINPPKADRASDSTNPSLVPDTSQTAPGPTSNPVIQMLAERAATDSELKDLMKIVANNKATADQVEKFQGYIEKYTLIEKARQTKAPDVTPINSKTDAFEAIPSSQSQPHLQILRNKNALGTNKQETTGVALEFSGGNGDRYSFPKYSILEIPPGSNQVIASFLIIRKGSDAEAHTYDSNLDYYQPITIRIYAHQSRQIEALQKAVKPPDEVRRWMNKVMDECQRAEYVLLAMRLPREADNGSVVESKDADRMNDQVNWATTNAPLEMPKIKSKKKLPTEEEIYEHFVTSVAAVT